MKRGGNRNHRMKSNRSVSPLHRTTNASKENIAPNKKRIEKRQEGNEEKSCQMKVEDSMKMCLELAGHHQQNALQLKAKNEQLEKKIKGQMKDMEALRKEI